MTASLPGGDPESVPWSQPRGAGERSDPADIWVTLVEFAGPDPLGVSHVEALMDHLEDWRPQGLWSPHRYAIQMHMPAPGVNQAVELSLAYHHEAARAAELPPSNLVRVEVMTVDELAKSWVECEAEYEGEPEAQREVVMSPPMAGWIGHELYTATRSLVAAATPTDINQVLVAFVTSIGARVRPGPAPHRPGTTNIDLSIEGGPAQHGVADSFSMAGLLIEGAVPTLMADARVALARLQKDQRKSDHRLPGSPEPGC